jgi:thioredoxin reductase (NADPH)
LSEERYDAIIIGAGPAGVTCALELHDSRKSYLLLEKGQSAGSQLDWLNTIKNYPPMLFENGLEFREHLIQLMDKVGCACRTSQNVTAVNCQEKTVTVDGVTFQSKAIVLATGFRRRNLDVTGLDIFREDIAYDYVPRKEHFQGRTVAVVGGGDSASLDALELAESCPTVYLIHRSPKLKARPDIVAQISQNPRIITLASSKLKALVGQGRLEGLQIESLTGAQTHVIAAERLIIQVGFQPNTDLVAQQVQLDRHGSVKIDQFCQSSSAGVFAVGDITAPGYPRIATAVGHGITAAAAIRRLTESD